MRPHLIEITDVLSQHPPQMLLGEDYEMIETFLPNAAQEALANGVHVGRLNGDSNDFLRSTLHSITGPQRSREPPTLPNGTFLSLRNWRPTAVLPEVYGLEFETPVTAFDPARVACYRERHMSDRPRGPKSPNRALIGVCRVARWSILVGVGLLVSQLFALGHLVLFTHTSCEHGALIHTLRHGLQRDARIPAAPEGSSSIASGGGSEVEHDHCNPFATPSALASVTPACAHASLLEALPPLGVCASEAEHSVGILALAPKTSPTA